MVFIAFRLRRFAHHLSILAGMPSSVLYFSFLYISWSGEWKTCAHSWITLFLLFHSFAMRLWLSAADYFRQKSFIHAGRAETFSPFLSLTFCSRGEKLLCFIRIFPLIQHQLTILHISKFYFFYDIKNFLYTSFIASHFRSPHGLRWRRRVFSAQRARRFFLSFVTAKFHR